MENTFVVQKFSIETNYESEYEHYVRVNCDEELTKK